MDRLAYIEALEIDDSRRVDGPFDGSRVASGEEGAAVIDAGSMISFLGSVSKQHQDDVKNSLLLAQLAANKYCNREDNAAEWYKKYQEVLETVGWVVSGFSFEKFDAFASQFEISEAVIAVLGAIATQNEILIVKAMLEALKSLRDGDKKLKLWNVQTHNQSNGNFQIASCIGKDGNVSMSLAAFYFKAKSVDVKYLWYGYNQDSIQLYKSTQGIFLNENVYAQIRAAVIKKLGDKANDYLADLDI